VGSRLSANITLGPLKAKSKNFALNVTAKWSVELVKRLLKISSVELVFAENAGVPVAAIFDGR
jgi:hypothetical protein